MEIGNCRKKIKTEMGDVTVFSLRELEKKGIIKDLSKMPYSVRIIAESMLRQRDGKLISDEDVITAASWNPSGNSDKDIPWIPARVLLQDLTGGAAVADLASMRAAVGKMGLDPETINPLTPSIGDRPSVQTDYAVLPMRKTQRKTEFERNREDTPCSNGPRSFESRVVPPKRNRHQVNLEYLSPLIHVKEVPEKIAYPIPASNRLPHHAD